MMLSIISKHKEEVFDVYKIAIINGDKFEKMTLTTNGEVPTLDNVMTMLVDDYFKTTLTEDEFLEEFGYVGKGIEKLVEGSLEYRVAEENAKILMNICGDDLPHFLDKYVLI